MAWKVGVVMARIPLWVRVATNSGGYPVAVETTDPWQRGDLVKFDPDSFDLVNCEPELVERMLVDVSHVSNGRTYVFNASAKWEVIADPGLNLSRGDKVVLENGFKAVERATGALGFSDTLRLGLPDADLLTGIKHTPAELEDQVPGFAGYEEERLEAEDFVRRALNPAAIYEGTLVRPPRGLVILGPPGTGKTTLAKHLAIKAGATLYILRGPEILSKWVGESEQNLRRIFDDAAQAENRPSIIFIDELDSLAMSRDTATQGNSKQVVATLLSLMDGLRGLNQTAVLGTTNRIEDIDSAFRRAGRFDHEIGLYAPRTHDREIILTALFGDKAPATGKIREVAQLTEGWTGADLYALARATLDFAAMDGRNYVSATDLADATSIAQQQRQRRTQR